MFDITWCETFAAPTFIKKEYLSSFIRMSFLNICDQSYENYYIIEEHIKKDNKSHIFKHLHSTATCFDSYNSLSFKTIDKALNST